MSEDAISKVRALEAALLTQPQAYVETLHVLHAGMYARTVALPAGMVVTGALIKVATLLIVVGEVTVFIGNETRELSGVNVLPASAGRKQAFVAHSDAWLTMIFPTDAATVEAAEEQFTDEADSLLSRKRN